jgi:cyclopropane-fatty-acyl-phospholipid synthase
MAAHGHNVMAITLSAEQLAWAKAEAQSVAFELRDYRDVTGQFDGIASVEMVEAVGRDYWPAYLDTIAQCLKPGGRAAIQFIIIADDVFDAYAESADFIQTYVFPGGMLLSESRFRALAEARGLEWHDPHYFGLHYAETLGRWRQCFDLAVASRTLGNGFDERFTRLWRYYLMYCEGGFRGGGIDVGQVTLIKRQ